MARDREKTHEKFGLETPDYKLLSKIDKNDLLISRKLIRKVRGKEELEKAIKSKNFYVLTGIMPSYEKIHFGTYGVIALVKFFQKVSKLTIVCIADVESYLTRNISLQKAKEISYNEHIPAYLSLGLDENKTVFYFQSENSSLVKIAIDAANNITLSNFREVYGDISPQRIYSSTYQIADILFPQLIKPMYAIVPVGLDQDPHLRLTRDYVRKTKEFKFIPPSSLYIETIPSLSGKEKMSKSEPESAIFLPEDRNALKTKIKNAFSGGGATIEEHKKRGANLEVDVCYKILRFIDKNPKFEEIAEKYRKGEILSGEFKEYAFSVLSEFMEEFEEKFKIFKDKVERREINLIRSAEELASYL